MCSPGEGEAHYGVVLDGNQYSPLGCDYTLFDPKTYVRTISAQKKLMFSLVIEVSNSDALWTSG